MRIGTRIGHYEITGRLGAGAMGEVYRAVDVQLGRDVAIKCLAAGLLDDPDRAARLNREARLLGQLNHPNIAILYSLEAEGTTRFLVMELVPGETLAARLRRGALPLEEALHVARQVAGGLQAAHTAGVIHRDLKPSNIMITDQRDVKLLDFGIATSGHQTSSPRAEDAPTQLTSTDTGMLIGTVPYMSPEQVRQLPVDQRADVWAFGCLLYEMVVGRAAFDRETAADTLAAVLETEPPYDHLPDNTPQRFTSLLRRCLRKDRDRRLRDIGDARLEIEELLQGKLPRRPRVRWLAAAAILTAVGFGLWSGLSWWQHAPGTAAGVAVPTDEQPLRIVRLALAPVEVPAADDAKALGREIRDLIERETKLTVVAPAEDHDAILTLDIRAEAGRLRIAGRVREAPGGANWWQQDWDVPARAFDNTLFARSLMSRLQPLLDLTSVHSTLRGAENREAALQFIHVSELMLGPAQEDLRVADQALLSANRALQFDPGMARARAARVALRFETVDWRPWSAEYLAEAETDIATALAEDDQDPVVHVGDALLAMMTGDIERARRSLSAAETRGPTLFWIYMIRAELEYKRGFLDLALAAARRGLEFDPYLLALHGRLVDVYLWRDEIDKAAIAVQFLSELDPGGTRGYWAGRARARVLLRQGEPAAAEDLLLDLSRRWAGSPWIHRELETFYREQGDLTAAEAAAERVRALVQ